MRARAPGRGTAAAVVEDTLPPALLRQLRPGNLPPHRSTAPYRRPLHHNPTAPRRHTGGPYTITPPLHGAVQAALRLCWSAGRRLHSCSAPMAAPTPYPRHPVAPYPRPRQHRQHPTCGLLHGSEIRPAPVVSPGLLIVAVSI